jgi:hypothetical protein
LARRAWFNSVISGRNEFGASRFQRLISYFSLFRYSSLPSLKRIFSPSSKAGPYIP